MTDPSSPNPAHLSQATKLLTSLVDGAPGWTLRFDLANAYVECALVWEDMNGPSRPIYVQYRDGKDRKVIDGRITVRLDPSLLRLAYESRAPILHVACDTGTGTAYYLWLQQWLDEQRTDDTIYELEQSSVAAQIPVSATLETGLRGRLREIATGGTGIRIGAAFLELIHLSWSNENPELANAVSALYDDFSVARVPLPIDALLDEIVRLDEKTTLDGKAQRLVRVLYVYCRDLGDRFSADQVVRLVTRGRNFSPTGLKALGVIYDFFPAHALSLQLEGRFRRMEQVLPSRYCRLRNRFIGISMRTLLARAMDVCAYRNPNGIEAGVLLRLRWVCRWEIAFAERLYQGMTDPALSGQADAMPPSVLPAAGEEAEFA